MLQTCGRRPQRPPIRLSGPSSRRLTSPLTVPRELRRCGLAWRSPPTRSHGGSQGFKSPHLHPILMTSGNAGHRHIRVRPEGPHNGWRTPNCASSAPWIAVPRPARCSAPSSGTSGRRTALSAPSATPWRALGGSRCSSNRTSGWTTARSEASCSSNRGSDRYRRAGPGAVTSGTWPTRPASTYTSSLAAGRTRWRSHRRAA